MTATMDPADVDEFRALIVRLLGLTHDDERVAHLTDVLRTRMTELGCPRFAAYRERLLSAAGGTGELRWLADQLTIRETYFFRDADSFRGLALAVLPERILARAHERRLSILSAGCASGEEPYSLAIALREALPAVDAWDIRILALDISAAALARAQQARFSAWSLRAIPENLRRRYFHVDGKVFVLDPSIQRMVSFVERNLVDPDPRLWPRDTHDLVLCRNVLMYFAPERTSEVVARIGASLVDGGYLFLGHAETLRGNHPGLALCHTHDTFYYRRHGDPASAPVDAWAGAPRPTSPSLPSDESWVDAIQRASDRIAALSVDPARSPAPAEPLRSARDLGPVLAAIASDRYADALKLLHALPPDALGEPDALLVHAAVLTHHDKLAEAESLCRRLLVLDGLHAGAHHLLALCREHAGDLAGAAEHDRIAMYLDADFALPHLHVGLMARRAGDPRTARRELGLAALLLAREDAARVVLFGGGFSRETLLALCTAELRAAGGAA